MIFLRHPRVAVEPGTCYGRLDLPLADGAEAEMSVALAGTPRCRLVVSSPAARCLALARRLAARDEVRLVTDPRLQELDFGAWEGRPWDRIDRNESDPWSRDPWNIAPPGGETFAALHDRVGAVLREAGRDWAVVSHAGPIRAARMILTGAGFDEVFAEAVPYARPIVMDAERMAANG